jgi:hypothetical protein
MLRMFCLALWFSAIGFGARAAASCVRPEIGELLEESRSIIQFEGTYFPAPEARFLLSTFDGRDVQWIGASWEGPVGGAIFLLDCAGKRIAATNLGAVKKLRFGPVLQARRTVEITYVPGTATGEIYSNVALALFDGTSIKMLWDHLVSDSVEMQGVGSEYDDMFQWRYSADGQTIEVTGRRKVGAVRDSKFGWPAGTTHALPKESYCWNRTESKFSRCR